MAASTGARLKKQAAPGKAGPRGRDLAGLLTQIFWYASIDFCVITGGEGKSAPPGSRRLGFRACHCAGSSPGYDAGRVDGERLATGNTRTEEERV
jgi:hypothetical protein